MEVNIIVVECLLKYEEKICGLHLDAASMKEDIDERCFFLNMEEK